MSPNNQLFSMTYQFNAMRDEAAAVILFKEYHRPNHRMGVVSRQSINSGAIDRISESTQPGILIPTNTELYNPAAWLKTGYSPSEILLSTAILVHAIGILLAAFKLLNRSLFPRNHTHKDPSVNSWAEFFNTIGMDAFTATDAQKKENIDTRTEQIAQGVGEWTVKVAGRSFVKLLNEHHPRASQTGHRV
jgi:hypothetical protein